MKKIKISFYINIVIFIFVLFGVVSMLTGFYFMGEEKLLTATRLGAFKFFTVDSNVFMGIISLIFSVYEYKLINKKIEIPKILYILKLMSTLGVTITFLITLLYLAPFYENGFLVLYKNSNLFFHLIVPLLSLITFVFFEKSDKIEFRETFYGLIPFILYSIFYVLNILLNEKTIKYDFYNFTNNGKNSIVVALIVIMIFVYLIDLIIWFLNRKRD